MQVNGFGLAQKSDGALLRRWTSVPDRLDLPNGDVLFSADIGWESEKYEIVAHSWTEVDPVAATRQLPKSLILSRLTDEQLVGALGLMTARQKERWRSPDCPVVDVDDPDLLAVLKAVGADAAVILA